MQFVESTLLPFINTYKFSETLVLGSSNAALRESVTSPRYLLLSAPTGSLSERLAQLSLDTSEPPPDAYYLPESGITLDLFAKVSEQKGKICAPVYFAYEGDNFEDAFKFATEVIKVLGKDEITEWIKPVSWDRVYGKGIPLGLEEGLYS